MLILDLRRFLLTPLREGRLINLRDLAVHHVISTHAPAGGATVVAAVAAVRIRISTHAPAGGATARRGRCRRKGQISTHAPAGGATKHDKGLHDFLLLFLLTPLREGRRIPDNLLPMLRDLFLLTPLREGRQDEIAGLRCGFIISTHAPAGGATHKCLKS